MKLFVLVCVWFIPIFKGRSQGKGKGEVWYLLVDLWALGCILDDSCDVIFLWVQLPFWLGHISFFCQMGKLNFAGSIMWTPSSKWLNQNPNPSLKKVLVSIVQWLSCVWLFGTPWTAAHQASLSFTVTQSLLKLRRFLVYVFVVAPVSQLISNWESLH